MDASMNTINSALDALREKRAEMLEQVAKLDTSIKTIEETFGIRSTSRITILPRSEAAASGPYTGMTIGNACVAFLRSKGSPQKTRAICDAIVKGGINSTSKNLYRTVYNTIMKREEVELVNKRWGLVK